MSIQEIVKILTESGIEANEASKEAEMLLEHFCGYTAKDRIMGIPLPEEKLALVIKKTKERANTGKPVQYIMSQAWFMGEWFKVTQDVLIPRDETEILTQEAVKIINQNNFKYVLDIGTGSGCIACIIAKQTDATVLGVDISSDALRIALDNVTQLGINNKAVFRKSDLFERVRENEKFDVIISNPPYIPHGTSLDREVLFEPKEALFADENGIGVYRRIIENAPKYLREGGYLMFELGIGESGEVMALMDKDFEGIYIIKDMAGIERTIIGKLKK